MTLPAGTTTDGTLKVVVADVNGDPAVHARPEEVERLRVSRTPFTVEVAWRAGAADVVDTRTGPPPGNGYYYLARGQNACGVGSYGKSSSGNARQFLDTSSPCPP